ncbi:SHOCT domain-containing protein [Candidatus Acidulodesulfobacterium sp. H_13]|uniref:SHOCT domain-containing protein n=1 Tax=Candidatus Acidulodesulfobacterium sp. H_13 TaxID=3395470 RepID=UPI003AF8EBB0
MGSHFFWGIGMWIFPIIWIIAILIVVYIVFGHGGLLRGRHYYKHRHDHEHHSRRHDHSESPLDVLNKRYAKGEITKEEYERIKKDISG